MPWVLAALGTVGSAAGTVGSALGSAATTAGGALASHAGSLGSAVAPAAGGVGPTLPASGAGAFGGGLLQGLSGGVYGGGGAAQPFGLNASTAGQLLGSRVGQGAGLPQAPTLQPQGAPGGQSVDPTVLHMLLQRILQGSGGGY